MASGELVVNVADSKYGTVPFLFPLAAIANLGDITRIRANRVLYRLPEPVDPAKRKRGRPKRYGERFDLKDGNTWGQPDEQEELEWSSKKGRSYQDLKNADVLLIDELDDVTGRYFQGELLEILNHMIRDWGKWSTGKWP